MDHPQVRLIGDYIVGPRIGSGSFAVVWRATHRQSGVEVAVKEIDKKLLSPKVSENLLKEISILSTINHPNIIRFFEAIKTNERIYLVLEYCDGGDLAEYIHRHGKVSEAVARHFMRQLALGLQILQEKHLIHRDLKPQNLLLSSDEAMPVLKIGDFGFARSLTPHDLADTLCGSPLYMAPEIIQNQKYDAKADLWSVGAILFQLVIGKPPFHGNSQYQLFQNILAATELRFPPGALEELHPDCVDLCRGLLCRNPVERITFEEFFNHKFLEESRETADLEWASSVPQTQPIFEQSNFSITEKRSLLQSTHLINSLSRDPDSASSLCDKEVFHAKDCGNPSSTKVVDSMESIEKGYVIVNPHFASIEGFSYHFEVSLQERSMARLSLCQSKKNDHIAEAVQTEELAGSSAGATESSQFNVSGSLESSCKSSVSNKVRQLSILHPSAKLQLLHHYVHALAELAAEKCNAGLLLESFSVQLVVLAIWKKTVQISGSWLTSSSDNELPGTSSAKESIQAGAILAPNSEDYIKFGSPSSICMWAKQGFIDAFERAEKLSCHILDKDAAIEMPDAMEIIYKKALSLGTNGAVEEYMENKASAAALYSKALLLLAFIVEEAPSLPLSPPFSLTPANKKRIQGYIDNLQSHQSQFQKLPPSPKPLPDFNTK